MLTSEFFEYLFFFGFGARAVIGVTVKFDQCFDPATFRSLGTKLAQHARVPVVPFCVASDFLRIGEWNRDLFASVHAESPLRVACGEPIPWDLPAAELQRRQTDFLSATLARWQKLDGRTLLLPPLPATV